MKAERTKNKRRSVEGLTIIEIMIVLVIIGIVGGGAALALLPKITEARIKQTKQDARVIRSAAIGFLAQNSSECPTVEKLTEGGDLDKKKKNLDAWDHPFVLECADGDITVISNGPDGQAGNDDDIKE